MHPVLFHIFGFPISSYGFMLILSFSFGTLFSSWKAKKLGLDPRSIQALVVYVILSAIIGARLYYIFLYSKDIEQDLYGVFNPLHTGAVGIGGLVAYGGFLGAIIAALIFFRVKRLPFLVYMDVLAPSIGFGIFFTRIGCFLNGCCYGLPSASAISVSFPTQCPAGNYQHQLGVSGLFPSQLFLAAGGLLMALLMLQVPHKKVFSGFRFYLTFLLYAVLRFAVDFTRYYDKHTKLGEFCHNQIVSIVLFIFFAALILWNVFWAGNLREGISKS